MNTSDSEQTQSQTTPATIDPMETALRQAAQAVDNGDEVNTDALLKASAADEAGTKTNVGKTPDKKTTASEGSERKTDTDPAKKKDGDGKDTTKPEDKKTEGKDDSKFEKAKKETERFDRNWKKLQEQAEQLKQREAALAERERTLAQGGQQRTRSSEPIKDKAGYTAKQYEEAATEWEKAGKFDLADMAKESAKALREQEKNGAQADQQTSATTQTQETRPPETIPGTEQFHAKWRGHVQELVGSEEYKELGNKESELYKATSALLQSEPRLSQFNDGIRIAAEIAKLRIEAGSVSVLRAQNAEQLKELEKLRKATTPGAGETESRGSATKSFESMSATEQEAHLKRAAAEVDNA